MLAVSGLADNIVLVELHDSCDILLIVLLLDNTLHIPCKSKDNLSFLTGDILLAFQVVVVLVHLELLFIHELANFGQFLHFLVEYVFQVGQLVFELVDLLIFRLQVESHFLGAIGQHVLRLTQVLDLVLILVQFSFFFLEFHDDILQVLFKSLECYLSIADLLKLFDHEVLDPLSLVLCVLPFLTGTFLCSLLLFLLLI